MALQHSPSIITDGLVLYLDAANPRSYPGTGTTWTDLSGNGNNGTLVNGVGYSTSNLGTLSFDGVNDYVHHPTNLSAVNAITNSSPFTFSSIFRLNSFPAVSSAATTGLLMKGSYNPSYGMNLFYSGDSGGFRTTARIYYGLRNLIGTAGVTQGYGNFNANSNSTIQLGQWYRVDLIHEFFGTTHTLRLYINGELDRLDTSTNNLYPINFQNTDSIGINLRLLGGDFIHSNLLVSSYSIYNKALTPQEIIQNFNTLRGRFNI